MLEKNYDPAAIEGRRYAEWEASGAFAARPEGEARPFTIVVPPPNVTGILHIGHALTFTLQDTLIRWRRMQGRDALWQPGTDHAGIATQMVVERKLAEEGTSREKLGREAFVARVWQWQEESGGTISRQLRRLGASLDWPRERFTMDAGLSEAVRRVFITLYREGLIYRARRLVNWDPKFRSAISDLEVESRELKGTLWHIRYRSRTRTGRSSRLRRRGRRRCWATSRSRCIRRIARYLALIGREAILPLVGRRIPIIADEYSDPEKGTGAVKITPAHDFNDFRVGERHGLAMPSVLDREAKVRLDEIEPFVEVSSERRFLRGLDGRDRFDARGAIVARARGIGASGKVRAACAPGPAWGPLGRADRAAADMAMVLQRGGACQAGDRGGGIGKNRVRAEAVGEHVLRLDAQPRALVHQPPALVGPSHPGLVRAGRQRSSSRRGTRRRRRRRKLITGRKRRCGGTRTCSTPGSAPRSGLSRRWAGPQRRRS